MNFKSIVVHLDASARAQIRLELAVQLAHRTKAHLTGIYAVFTPESDSFYVMAGTGDYFLQVQKAREARLKELEHFFRSETARLDVPGNWLGAVMHPNAEIPHQAHYADLVIAGQLETSDPESYVDAQFQENLVLSAGRPVLFVPHAGGIDSLGERVLVAWDGSRSATRAAHDALPFLKHAQQITFVTVTDQTDPRLSTRIPGADAALMLARQTAGVKMTNVTDTRTTSVGKVLLSQAAAHDADLLVMGAYGHSRWRELVMGGTTRTVLESMTLPVLMSF